MSASVIDISGIELQGAVRLTIDNVTFTIELEWFERLQRWVVNLYDESGFVIVAGAFLHPYNPVNPRPVQGLPPGVIYATRFDGGDAPFTRNRLNEQATLWYEPRAEFDAERALPDFVGTLNVV